MIDRHNVHNSKHYFLICLGVCVFLLLLGFILRAKASALKKDNLANIAMLREVLPEFDSNSVTRLKEEVGQIKTHLAGLIYLFDPKYKWLKKDYDISIYFVEELGKTKQLLKAKSEEKQVNNPELGFKEKLPSTAEAVYLLSQLYSFKEIVGLGMDYGINFKSLNPYVAEAQAPMPGVKMLKSRIELSCPSKALIDFIIQLNEIIPKVCFESLSLKSVDSSFDMDLVMGQIVTEGDLSAKPDTPASVGVEEIQKNQQDDFIRLLRNNNPFFIASKEGVALPIQISGKEDAGQLKPAPRFIYRGKAILRKKEVAAIEDTLRQETVFLGRDERIGDFTLSYFSDSEIILKNISNNEEIIIKREEK